MHDIRNADTAFLLGGAEVESLSTCCLLLTIELKQVKEGCPTSVMSLDISAYRNFKEGMKEREGEEDLQPVGLMTSSLLHA